MAHTNMCHLTNCSITDSEALVHNTQGYYYYYYNLLFIIALFHNKGRVTFECSERVKIQASTKQVITSVKLVAQDK